MACGHDAPYLPAHWVALVTVGYHAYTWWKVAPKTRPICVCAASPCPSGHHGRRLAATIGASVLIYVLVRWL